MFSLLLIEAEVIVLLDETGCFDFWYSFCEVIIVWILSYMAIIVLFLLVAEVKLLISSSFDPTGSVDK